MLERLLDFVLPPACGGCGARGTWFCSHCRVLTRYLAEPLCRRCGQELGASGRCPCRLSFVDSIRSAVALEGPLERTLHRFKYEGCRPLARPLAEILAVAGREAAPRPTLAVGVPLHARRLRERGYNQADLLVAALSRHVRLLRPPGRLVRVRATPAQVGLDRRRRLTNLRAAFAWSGESLRNQPVIVVDDVSTTGATLDACAQALRRAGAGSVTGLTVARTGS